MKRVAILLADGFEEIEAITPKDVLNRAGIQCDLISIKEDLLVKGAHDVTIKADQVLSMSDKLKQYNMVVLPGGMPGAKYLAQNEQVISIIKEFNNESKYISAICASPALVLSRAEVLTDKKFTCYPGMQDYVQNAIYREESVVQDENIITSRGPATAFDFAYKLVDVLDGNSDEIKQGMLYSK